MRVRQELERTEMYARHDNERMGLDWDSDYYSDMLDRQQHECLEMDERHRLELQQFQVEDDIISFSAEGSTEVRQLVIPDFRRYCWRCSSDVFVYHQGLYWCQDCIGNSSEDVEDIAGRITYRFGGLEYMTNLAYMYFEDGRYRNEDFDSVIINVMEVMVERAEKFRNRAYQDMDDSGNVRWTNRHFDEQGNRVIDYTSSPFVTSIRTIYGFIMQLRTLMMREMFEQEDVSIDRNEWKDKGVKVTQWKNKNGGYTYNITKTYLKDNKFQETKVWFPSDIEVLQKLLAAIPEEK